MHSPTVHALPLSCGKVSSERGRFVANSLPLISQRLASGQASVAQLSAWLREISDATTLTDCMPEAAARYAGLFLDELRAQVWRSHSKARTQAAGIGNVAKPNAVTLLPLGDSITDGGMKQRSYRFHLHQLFEENGHRVRWVGSMHGVYDKQLQRNATVPQQQRFGTCAVVGNSGTLLLRELGNEIDAHDAVFRVNHAPVPSSPEGQKYVKHAGAKTTWRIATSRWFDEEKKDPAQTILALCDRPFIYSCQNLLFESGPKPRIHNVNPLFYAAVRRHTGDSKIPTILLIACDDLMMASLIRCGGTQATRRSPSPALWPPLSPSRHAQASTSTVSRRCARPR